MEDNFYIEGLHKGNEKVFRLIFEKYHTRLCYFASNLLPLAEHAEDVVQEAFVRLWNKKNDFHNMNAIKAFLYITVKNRCLNIAKHDKVTRKYADLVKATTTQPDIIRHLVEAETLEKIYQALQKLPVGCRKVLRLSYFEEMKNKEVAEYLHISINTVKTQKMRGLHLLRTILKGTSFILVFFESFL